MKGKIEYEVQENGCWNCINRHISKGYAMIRFNYKNYYAHRLMYELINKVTLKADIVVRHTCDNPLCVNPAHLILGTRADNVRDRI